MAKKINYEYALNPNALFNDFCLAYAENDRTLDNFKHFLEISGLSTEHAEEILVYCNNPTENSLILNEDSFKIRKTHPKRDAAIKKGFIPTAITSSAIGASIASIMASGLPGGSKILLGLGTVSGTPGLTELQVLGLGAILGLASTPIIFKAKRAITNLHYKVWYKSAKTNLEEYKSKVDINSLHIASLMEKIENTKKKILKTKNGAWFTAPFRFMRRHALNVVNRNRIHHLEAYTKDLVKEFHTLENNNFEGKDKSIKPVYDLLKQVDDFVTRDVLESKIYAMLTCKESGKHTHKSMIENVDIFANLKIYVDALSNSTLKGTKKATTQAKKNSKNIRNKKSKATEIINGERLIARLVSNYESSLQPIEEPVQPLAAEPQVITPVFTEPQVITPVMPEPIIQPIEEPVQPLAAEPQVITPVMPEPIIQPVEEPILEEPIVEEIPVLEEIPVEEPVLEEPILEEPIVEEIPVLEEIPVEEPIVEPIEETVPAITETTGKLLVKTAQRLSYETKPITNDGAVVGTTLKIKSNGETEKVEIRYMSSKKQIRVKTTGEDNIVAQRYIPLRDTTIPPIEQMNDILRQVAEEKHISNINDLIIN